jgi:hypothetical protein
VRADNVSAPPKISDLLTRHERGRTDAVGSHQEMTGPPETLQKISSVAVGAHAAIVKREQHQWFGGCCRVQQIQSGPGCFRRSAGDGTEMLRKLSHFELVSVGVGSGKAARPEVVSLD